MLLLPASEIAKYLREHPQTARALLGESFDKRFTAENPSILDTSYSYFDARAWGLHSIHIRMDTFWKWVNGYQKSVVDVTTRGC